MSDTLKNCPMCNGIGIIMAEKNTRATIDVEAVRELVKALKIYHLNIERPMGFWEANLAPAIIRVEASLEDE